MPTFKSTIEFNALSIKEFKQTMLRLSKVKEREDLIVAAAKSAVVPWQHVLKNNIYGIIERKSGKMARSIGRRKYKDKKSGRVGAEVGPARSRRQQRNTGDPSGQGLGSGGQGWRLHFFAEPARQMDPKYKLDFQSIYSRRNNIVIQRMRFNMKKVIEHIKNKKSTKLELI